MLRIRSQHINFTTSPEFFLALSHIFLATLLIYINFHEIPFESHSHGVHGVNASVSNYNKVQIYEGHQKQEKGIDCASSIFCANTVYEDDASMKFQFDSWIGALE